MNINELLSRSTGLKYLFFIFYIKPQIRNLLTSTLLLPHSNQKNTIHFSSPHIFQTRCYDSQPRSFQGSLHLPCTGVRFIRRPWRCRSHFAGAAISARCSISFTRCNRMSGSHFCFTENLVVFLFKKNNKITKGNDVWCVCCFFGWVPTWKGVIPMIVWFFWIVRKCDDDCVVSNNFTTAIILRNWAHLESSWLHSTTQWHGYIFGLPPHPGFQSQMKV